MNQNREKGSNKLTAIVGLGRSGIGAAKLLKKEGKKIIILEENDNAHFRNIKKSLESNQINVQLGKPLKIESFKPFLEGLDEVIISPAISWQNKTLEKLRHLGIGVKSEISLSWERMNHIPWICITGTNGKTTVTEMLNHIFKKNKINIATGGNNGHAASEIALKYKDSLSPMPSWLIMELSSYQIESGEKISPHIGIWTTFTPDHLDRHKTLENYFNIKKTLLDHSNIRIYNGDDQYLVKKKESLGAGIWIKSNFQEINNKRSDYWINKEGVIYEGSHKLFHSSVLKLPGKHNLNNFLLAIAAARKAGLESNQIKYGISDFSGVAHRLELIGKFKSINIYNDSKATNYESSAVGIASLKTKSIVISGGLAKEGNPLDWIDNLNIFSCAIFLYGSSAKKLESTLIKGNYQGKIFIFSNLKEATYSAFYESQKMNPSNIILSPACSSFDQYKDFEERGNQFKNIVKSILNIH